MKAKSVSTLAGTIVAAILASSCCIGPLVLAGLGIGSIGAFSSLEKYRPIFMLVTFAFIGMAFYFTYRKKNGEDACCKTRTNRIKKIALWVITVVAVGLMLFPYFYGSFGKSVSNVTMGDNMKNVVIEIEGMTCEGCAQTIRSALLKIQSVKAVDVSLEKKEAVVGFENDRENILANELLTTIDRAGYKCKIKKETFYPEISM